MPRKGSPQAKYNTSHPWVRFVEYARRRCAYGPEYRNYHNYKGKGITCTLVSSEVEILWHHYKASTMKKPSLDRIDPDKNYSFENCRFMEHTLNSRRSWDPKADIEAGIEEAPSFS